ncbi:MAG: exodeoxyribonuclease VII small subunit [Panacagrimonas sp.]
MPKRSEPSIQTPLLEQVEPVVSVEVSEDTVARFEQDMQELETIVAQMEKGDLRLEDSLKLFERGTQLARSCRKSLDTAELKVRNLLDEDEGGATAP